MLYFENSRVLKAYQSIDSLDYEVVSILSVFGTHLEYFYRRSFHFGSNTRGESIGLFEDNIRVKFFHFSADKFSGSKT